MASDKAIRAQIGPTTSLYEKRKKRELLQQLWISVNTADNRISRKRLQFHGKPVPSTSIAIEQSGDSVPTGPTANEMCGYENTSLLLTSPSHIVLRDISHCEVASALSLSSVHVDGALDSVLMLHSDGAVSIRNAKNSSLVIKCHQIRLHDLDNCTVWAQVANNRIIIENCRNITFGGYNHRTRTLNYPQFEVDDFDWPTRRIVSPHYRYISSDNNEIGMQLPSVEGEREWGKRLRSLVSKPTESAPELHG